MLSSKVYVSSTLFEICIMTFTLEVCILYVSSHRNQAILVMQSIYTMVDLTGCRQ